MKSPFVFITYILSATLILIGETTTLRIIDNYSTQGDTNIQTPLTSKENRLSSSGGTINATYESSIPDSIKVCIDLATDIWASKLENTTPLFLTFKYENLGSDDIITDVIYQSYADGFIPRSLYSELTKDTHRNPDTYDAIISINSLAQWDCTHTASTNSNKKSLTSGILRAICNALGFGSSVHIGRRNILMFGQSSGYSVFDKIIVSSEGKWLKDIPNNRVNNNPDLNQYVQPISGSNLYAGKILEPYRLYAPPIFEPFRSLIYLDNPSSLMHYQIPIGDQKLQIDDISRELLREIGWTIKSPSSIRIQSSGIDDNGIASAYECHSFTLDLNGGTSLSNPTWEYYLPLSSGELQLIKTGSEPTFEIPAIDNESIYGININGDIYGQIIFNGILDGEPVSDIFRISLELKPRIYEITITDVIDNTPEPTYNVNFKIRYAGADKLIVGVEEEYGLAYQTWVYHEPYLVKGVARNIMSSDYAWIDFTVDNKYGSVTKTIELAPGGVVIDEMSSDNKKSANSDSNSSTTIYKYLIYNSTGTLITTFNNREEFSLLPNGTLYFIHVYHGDECKQRIKYQKR